MKKISIKREQSQAGLSFAEREKFRPQVKNKLFLLLALLLTAATGAWAQGGGDAAKYTKAVAISELKVGDILAQGASITGESSDAVKLDPNRSKVGNDVVGTEVGLNLTVSFGTNGTINNQYAPVTESGQDGDAWVVTNVKNQFGIYTVNLAGILMTGSTEPVAGTYTVSLKDGVKDADKWTITPNPAEEGQTVTLQYTGRLKVKGVKATSDAAPAAVPVTAITLNKTETSIKVGATETLSVTSVLPEEATDKTYTWKTSDESKATVDQDGKVTAVAAGTVTIYAEANDGSGVKGNCAVTVTPATITVTINQSDWGNGYSGSFTKDGVTVSAEIIDSQDGNLMGGGTFSTTLGNFTKIVVTTFSCYASGTGWSGSGSSMTWAGTPASTVSFSGEFMGRGRTQTTIVCTIVPAN